MKAIRGLLGCVLLCVAVSAGAAPFTFNDCAMRGYPILIINEVEYGPGVHPDTLDIEVDSLLTVYTDIGVDDSTAGAGPYHCNDDSIEAQWDGGCDDNLGGSFWFFDVRLFIDQPEPPDHTRYEFEAWSREISEAAAGVCAEPLYGSPERFLMGSVAFAREGLGALVVRGRILDFEGQYLAPTGDSCKVYYNVVHTQVGTGQRVMVPK